MSIRMFPRRRGQHHVPAGEDKVIFGLSMPSESRLNGLTAQVHIMNMTPSAITSAMMYGIEGYILPVLDPDSAPTHDVLWNTLVPKDDDTDTIDLDTSAADAQPFFEPGEMALAEVMDVGLQPERIYARHALKSFANSGFRQEDTSVLEWVISDIVNIRIKKRYFVRQPSVILFAVAAPDLLDTSNVAPAALAENEWARVKYMELVLEQALMQHFGLTEAGAETPWLEAAQLLRKYIEPDVYEETAGTWAALALRVFVNATFDVSMPGQMSKIQIGSGG